MAVKYGRLENVTLAYWNKRPKKIGQRSCMFSAFAKNHTDGKNYLRMFIWNNDEYDKSNGQI